MDNRYSLIKKQIKSVITGMTAMDVEELLDEIFPHYAKETTARKNALGQEPRYILKRNLT
jgi:hypothetical protein